MKRSSWAVWKHREPDAARHAAWVRDQLDRVPGIWRRRVAAEYERRLAGGEFAGNSWLRETAEEFRGFLLSAAATDSDICAKADEQAAAVWSVVCGVGARDIGATYWACRRYVEARGMESPPTPTGELSEIRGAVARMLCPLWWRRQIRKRHGRRVEQGAIRLGYVSLRAGKYCSDLAVGQRQQQKRRNAESLAAVELENQFGDVFTLAALAERSNANPVIRRSELMTRIGGFEAVARGLGHVAEFLTLTAPSRYHAMRSADCEPNPAWEQGGKATPREAQAHLSKCWQRMRAWLARRKVGVYGFRIAEPHHDGCPHWHVLLFMAGGARDLVRYAASKYFLIQHQPDEPGARDNRVKAVSVRMDESSSAAGYVIKYVSKNIDGYAVQKDLFGGCAVEGAARVDAWAARWGIRQFQQIGGAPVGVWRELRRVSDEQGDKSEALELARLAADVGAWADYVTLQGGPTVRRADMPLELAKVREGEAWNAAEKAPEPAAAGRYGDCKGGQVFGVRCRKSGAVAVSRLFKWSRRGDELGKSGRVGRAGCQGGRGDSVGFDVPFVVGGGRGDDFGFCEAIGLRGLARPQAAQPWTRVNNCTGVVGEGSIRKSEGGGAGDVFGDSGANSWPDSVDDRRNRSLKGRSRGAGWQVSGSGM